MAELNEAGHDATASEGSDGEFNVFADGDLLFSKRHEGRFPEEGEVLGALRKR